MCCYLTTKGFGHGETVLVAAPETGDAEEHFAEDHHVVAREGDVGGHGDH